MSRNHTVESRFGQWYPRGWYELSLYFLEMGAREGVELADIAVIARNRS
jgi:hypothetical protein